MSSIIRFLVNQFSSKKMIDIQYIDIKPLIEVYKSIKGNRKTTFVAFVKTFGGYFLKKPHETSPMGFLPISPRLKGQSQPPQGSVKADPVFR